MIQFEMLHPKMTQEHLGLLPGFLDESDPRSAREQFNENYAHGGGWNPFEGFKMLDGYALKYPGDPAHKPLAKAKFRDELILYYQYSWVVVMQPDGSWEVTRMD
jgi:hypothetical protein